MSSDVWWTTQSSQFIANGGFGAVYSVNPWFTALPGFLVLLAPVVALGDHLGLVSGAPWPLPHPSMWLLVGPFYFLVGATVVPGLDYLMWTVGLARRMRRMLSVGVAVVVVLPTPGLAGHPEDLLALSMVCLAVAWHLQGRSTVAAWTLAGAICMQTWAVLLVPLFIATTPAGRRVGEALRCAAIPTGLGILMLAGDFRDAALDLIRQPMPNAGQQLPWHEMAGHVRLQIDPHSTLTVVAGSSTRSVAVLIALVVGWHLRRGATAPGFVLAAGAVLFSRCLFETEYWAYYLAPAAVLLAVAVVLGTEGRPRRLVTGLAGCLLMYLSAPAAYNGVGYDPWIALVVLVATFGLAAGAARPDLHGLVTVRSAARRRYAAGPAVTG
jgi:hypothetical protein